MRASSTKLRLPSIDLFPTKYLRPSSFYVQAAADSSENPPPAFTKPRLLKKCVALLQTCTSLASLKGIHAHAIRGGLPLSDADLAKHLIFAVLQLSAYPMPYAAAVLSQVPRPGVFTLNTIIRGYSESPDPAPALLVHGRMRATPVPADTHTYPFLLKACARLLDLRAGQKVHALAVKDGHASSVFILNALVSLYGACGLFETAHRLFEEMPLRNLVTWNSVINGFAISGRPNEVLKLVKDLWALREAEEECDRVLPDGFTIVNLLCACVEIGALALGRRTHGYVFKGGLECNVHVGNALIDLYGKCGSTEEARAMFDEMSDRRTAVSWTSLIVGLAASGNGEEAVQVFQRMESEGLEPTEITFVAVLYACSHCGWVEKGIRYFNRMRADYGVVPKIEHYGCMIDLLGRAGLLKEAYRFLIKMPMEPNAVVWRALLGACAMHKSTAFAEATWVELERLDPGHSGDYVLLSNLYASSGRWADVQRIRRRMVKGGVQKTPGFSFVELGNKVHEFVMGDRSHPESDLIYKMLEEIALRLKREGYTPGTTNVLADIDEEEKEKALLYHSERLAIAYALLRAAPGVTIRIVKNLRVCEDCHLVTKLISKAYGREIVLRDRSRFHRFKDGSCSCKDYW